MGNQKPWLISRNAYSIFRKEVVGILSWTRTVISDDLPSAHGSTLKRLRTEMHKIKGSAGFFGFDRLAQLAADFEAQVLLASPPLSDRLDGLKEILAGLDKEADALPEPPDEV